MKTDSKKLAGFLIIALSMAWMLVSPIVVLSISGGSLHRWDSRLLTTDLPGLPSAVMTDGRVIFLAAGFLGLGVVGLFIGTRILADAGELVARKAIRAR